MLIDHSERNRATDPGRSFIVQAPAGSGKTEILTQRFLRLLSQVQTPEQIIALTFTRKAASEMRQRILNALQQAAHNKKPESEHEARTLEFAHQALKHNQNCNWQLLDYPARLQIITIDSLCQTINRAIPLQDKQIAFSQISDYPQNHYREAARACFQFALETESYQPALKTVLIHLDNRQDDLLSLFCNLLANRDKWLGPLYEAREQEKADYEEALTYLEEHTLNRLHKSLPTILANSVLTLTKKMIQIENNPAFPRYGLLSYEYFQEIDKEGAKSLADLILTKSKEFRKAFDHHIGLKRGICDDNTYTDIKSTSKKLLAELNDYPEFLQTLLEVGDLPNPHYDLEQWDVLHALFTLLPLLVGHLHLRFSEHNTVDFTAVSQQALSALGEPDNPTDLALYLDNRIQHLLVDEFQDTSISQFQLLTQLVQGWELNDGKTLFVVGDPMQSIYRFRQAEVGLFLKAKEQGIGSVKLIPLELRCNFRSSSTLVNWVNDHFCRIFPQTNDIESGAISFHPSTSLQEKEQSGVYALQFDNKEQEAQALVNLIQEQLAKNPTENIAILVRSRNQLSEIIHLLREYKIPYQGIDIALLAKLPHLRDVWSLTKALLMPANRLAWLELLRSPCCGLSLEDLHILANINKYNSLYSALSESENRSLLSEEGSLRAAYIYSVLQEALSNRHQSDLSDWVEKTLKNLHGNHFLEESHYQDLEQFWILVDRFEEDGQLPDIQAFENEFLSLYSQQVTPSKLQVMTIHKSKGLEFDCVILPGLGSLSRNQDKPLLRWLKLPLQTGKEILLVSPIKASDEEKCDLYDYLGRLNQQKDQYELQRLLYVGVTRAKKSLYLFDKSDRLSEGSFRNLLKNQEFLSPEQPEKDPESNLKKPNLYKLPLSFYQNPYSPSSPYLNQVTLNPTSDIPRLTGIISHQILQWICDNHPENAEAIPAGLINQPLKYLCLDPIHNEAIYHQIKTQIHQLFKSEIGSWIIQAHEAERNEYPLLVTINNKVVTRIIDRTFCDQGIRWIIDFKTGKEEEHLRFQHRKQVNEYAHYLPKEVNRPIKCGLYYLATDSWECWDWS